MKNLALSRSHVLAFLLVLAGMPAKGDTSFTSTGWLNAVPLPGIMVTNSAGQISLKGNAHVVRLQADDERVTGRLEAWMDMAYQPDGTAVFSGPAYAEVGTWDSAGMQFTPTAGVWALNYSGTVQVDGSSQYEMAGYGIGGAIDSMRISVTATRTNSEPTSPYLALGAIKPAPVNTREVVDDFADNHFTWPAYGVGPGANPNPPGTFFVSETNQQLTIGGTWTSRTPRFIDSAAWADLPKAWSVSSGQTLEARVDMVALSQYASGTAMGLYYSSAQAYVVLVGRNYIALVKEEGLDFACFSVAQAPIQDNNLVLSLALTPMGKNVVLTGKVLDKASGHVIAQVVATDTPASDPTLSASKMAELTGGRVWQGLRADPVGAPPASGVAPAIFVGQEADTVPVTASATFDNFELRTYEVPQVGIEPAVRISWPDTGMDFTLERASSPLGPWVPVQSSETSGTRSVTVPTSAPAGFFQLQQKP